MQNETQNKIIELIFKQYNTITETAKKLNISRQAVHKHLTKLKDEGKIIKKYAVYNEGLHRGVTIRGWGDNHLFLSRKNHYIRLHNLHLQIKIIKSSDKYDRYVRNNNAHIYTQGDTVRLNKNNIEIYTVASFMGNDVHEATVSAQEYILKRLHTLESRFNIILVKEGSQNIKIIKTGHYSDVNNELSIKLYNEGLYYNVHSTDDHKIWLSFDNSFNLKEAETKHTRTSKEDMQEHVSTFFNTLRDNPEIPKYHEITQLIKRQAELSRDNGLAISTILELLKRSLTPPEQIKPEITEEKIYYAG